MSFGNEGVSQAPKQEPDQMTIFALVFDCRMSTISFAFGLRPSGSWMQTFLAFSVLIRSAALSSSRLYCIKRKKRKNGLKSLLKFQLKIIEEIIHFIKGQALLVD
jgi:hypothetical protein